MNPSELKIIILNYNGGQDTVECVEFLIQSGCPPNDIIIVDNGSTDDSLKMISERLRGVRIIESDTNLGYAGGNNLGIIAAMENGASSVLILNNDVVIDYHAVKWLRCYQAMHANVGVIGPLVATFSQRDETESAGAAVKWYRGYSRPLHRGKRTWQLSQDPFRVDYVSGSAMMIAREAIERAGLFSPNFFMYCEDEDLCLRISRAGLEVLCCPSVRAWHKGGKSASRSKGLKEYFEIRNRFLIMKRYATRIQMMSFLCAWLWFQILYYARKDLSEKSGLNLTCARLRASVAGMLLFLREERVSSKACISDPG